MCAMTREGVGEAVEQKFEPASAKSAARTLTGDGGQGDGISDNDRGDESGNQMFFFEPG